MALVLGSLVNGLGAYLYIALGTRAYGAEVFAPVSVVWSFWAISAAVLTFPIQHWAIRRITLDGHDGGFRRSLGGLGGVVLAVSAFLGVLTWTFRIRLFGGSAVLWPALVAAVTVGAAVSGYARGLSAGRRRYYLTAVLTGSENLVRLVAGAAAIVLGTTVAWFGASLVLGPLLVAFCPALFRLDRRRGQKDSVVAFIGGTAGGFSLSQIALNAGPVVLSLLGGEPARVTGLFAAMALFRAPHLVALGLAARATGPLTRLIMQGEWHRLRQILGQVVLATGLGAVGGGIFGYWAGTSLILAVFGIEIALNGLELGCIAAGSVVAVATLVLTLLAIARGDTISLLVAWGLGLGTAAAVLVLRFTTPTLTAVLAFLAAELVAFGWLLGVQVAWLRAGARFRG